MNDKTPPQSLWRLLGFLAVWFVVTWILAGMFIPPVPPGGVRPLYYVALLLIPCAVFNTAAFYPRWSVPICYGAITGVFFGYIPFIANVRFPVADASLIPIQAQHVLWFTAGVIAACLYSFKLALSPCEARPEEPKHS